MGAILFYEFLLLSGFLSSFRFCGFYGAFSGWDGAGIGFFSVATGGVVSGGS